MKVDFVRNLPLFTGLSGGELAQVASILEEKRFSSGAGIYNSGEACDTLCMIHKGFVRLVDESGRVVATLGPGSLLGESEFLRGQNHTMSAISANDVETWCMSDGALRRLLQKYPAIGLRLSANFGGQPVQMEDYLVERLSGSTSLGELPRNLLRVMAQRLRPHHVPTGGVLFRVGDQPHGLFLIESGRVEVRPQSEGGEVRLLGPGELAGVLPLLTNKPYESAATGLEESLVWVLPTADFYSLSSQYPLIRRVLGRRVRSRLGAADQTQAVIRLAQTPLFADMGPQNLHAIAQRLVLQHVPAGETIFQSGDSGDALYLVDSGEVEITAENTSGVVEELDRIATGGYFGEMSLLTGRNHTANATSIRNSNLWILYKADLDELVTAYPTIGSALNQVVASQLAAQEEAVDEARFRRFPLLENLSSREIKDVIRHLKPSRFQAGEAVYTLGEEGDALFLIERGEVQMQPPTGAPWLLSDGEIFGEKAVLTQQPRALSARAINETDVLILNRQDLDALMMRIPGLSVSLSRLLSQRLTEAATSGEAGTGLVAVQGSATLSQQRRRGLSRPTGLEVGAPGEASGSWFTRLSGGAKLRLALLLLILLYLFGVAAPSAIGRLLSGPTVASGDAAFVSANAGGAIAPEQEVAMSRSAGIENQLVGFAPFQLGAPTATFTPPPTNTPIPTPTPTVTPTATNTPLPSATPTFTPVPPTPVPVIVEVAPQVEEPEVVAAAAVSAAPARAWDGRLSQLGVNVADAQVASGQPYWRLIEARWENEAEARGKHHIYVETLDEAGNRLTGQPVTVFWGGGSASGITEDKTPPEFAFNYPMYKAGNSYNVKIEGLPSDILQGAGLGTPDLPFHTIHTNVKLVFQRTIAP